MVSRISAALRCDLCGSAFARRRWPGPQGAKADQLGEVAGRLQRSATGVTQVAQVIGGVALAPHPALQVRHLAWALLITVPSNPSRRVSRRDAGARRRPPRPVVVPAGARRSPA